MQIKVLDGWKSYIVAGLGLAVGVAEMLGFDVVPGVDPSSAGLLIMNALGLGTLRSGVASVAAKVGADHDS